MSQPANNHLEGSKLYLLVAFNIIVGALLGWALVVGVSWVPVCATELTKTPSVGQALIRTIVILGIAGALGGILCNLRGIYKSLIEEDFFRRQDQIPFYIRPFMGALNGVFVFFLGHLIVSALADPGNFTWMQPKGILSYVGIALLAGFASQEFLQKLKEVAKTVFNWQS